jgi:hypothetical protein
MKRVLFFFLLTIVFFACNKYEEGPSFSLRTKKHRLVNTWAIDKYYVNGSDSTVAFLTEYVNYIYTLNNNNSYSIKYSYNNVIQQTITGTWDWADGKEQLILSQTQPVATNTQNILRLKESELWVEYIDESYGPGAVVRIHFISVL